MSAEQKTLVDLIVASDPEVMTDRERLRLVSIVAAYVGVCVDEIHFVSIAKTNSSVIRLEMPRGAANRLVEGFKRADPLLLSFLRDYGLSSVDQPPEAQWIPVIARPPGNPSVLIGAARRGDMSSLNELLLLIYPELKRRARWLMTKESEGHDFGPDGLELVQLTLTSMLESGTRAFEGVSREEDLVNVLTRRMRNVLVDYARSVSANQRPHRSDPEGSAISKVADPVNVDEIVAAHEAVDRLSQSDPDAAMAIELRFFGGLSNEEAAATMRISTSTYRRCVKRATVFLRETVGAQPRPSPIAPRRRATRKPIPPPTGPETPGRVKS